jgi:hypothetical protein
MGYETGLNEKRMKEINDFFKPLKAKYVSSGLLDPFVMGPKPTLWFIRFRVACCPSDRSVESAERQRQIG